MSKVILQPAGNPDARKHYVDTIQSKVSIDQISNFVDINDINVIKNIYVDGAYVWGVTPGKNLVNYRKWKRIKRGDVCLFSRAGHIFASGVVTYKIHNKDLALDLWQTDDNRHTWEYIFFLDEIVDHNISYIRFNEVVGYSPNFTIRGFSILDEEKSDKILQAFNLKSKIYFPGDENIRNYWWVNQKQTHKQEIDGGYMWSPKKMKNGNSSYYYDCMKQVKPGDIIYSYYNQRIQNIGIAESKAETSDRPSEFNQLQKWDKNGWKVNVRYHSLINPLSIKDNIQSLKHLLPHKYKPFNEAGNGLEFYLTSVNNDLSNRINSLIGDQVKLIIDNLNNVEHELLFINDSNDKFRLKIIKKINKNKNLLITLNWDNDFKNYINKLESKEHLIRANNQGHSFPLYYLSIVKNKNQYFISKKIHSLDYFDRTSKIKFKLGPNATWGYWNKNNIGLKLMDEIRKNISVEIPSSLKNSKKLIDFFSVEKNVDSNSVNDFINWHKLSIEEYIKKIIDLEKTDGVSISKTRKEQSHLRNILFKNKKEDFCGICNNELPINLLWCSHIKKRSECTYEERTDYNNIVMPMCKFGCDELYEKGYIYVVDGIIKINPSMKTTKDLRGKLLQVSGKKIDSKYYNENTIIYFNYHEKKYT